MDKLIALVLDDQLVSAPRVRDEICKYAVVTGNGLNGVSEEEIQRIVVGVTQPSNWSVFQSLEIEMNEWAVAEHAGELPPFFP